MAPSIQMLPKLYKHIIAQFHQVQHNFAKIKLVNPWNIYCYRTANSSKENKYSLGFSTGEPTDKMSLSHAQQSYRQRPWNPLQLEYTADA